MVKKVAKESRPGLGKAGETVLDNAMYYGESA